MSDFTSPDLAVALTAHDAGDFDTARRIYREILAVNPLNPETNFFLGMLALQTSDLQPATEFLQRAGALNPADAGCWNYLGLARLQERQFRPAAEVLYFSTRCDPSSYEAVYNLGIAYRDLEEKPEAVVGFIKALCLNPSSWMTWSNLGSIWRSQSKLVDALVAFIKARLIAPDTGEPIFNIGLVLQDQRQWSEALIAYETAVGLFERDAVSLSSVADQSLAEACRNHGIVLTTMGRSGEARRLLEKSLVVSPGSLLTWNNYGNALKENCSILHAKNAYVRALQIDANYPEAEWNTSLLFLLSGDFLQGFTLYESRLRVKELFPEPREVDIPRYVGADPVAGKRIFLYTEQGLGDTMQFSRFAKRLCIEGAHVILEVPAVLAPLLRQSGVASEVMVRGDPVPAADLQCALMSLPAAWGLDERRLAMDERYLHADTARVERWGEIIERDPEVLNIGICWRGGDGFRGNLIRSFTPDLFARIAQRENINLYSLQKNGQVDDGVLASLGIACFDDDFDSNGAFLDSIAVLEHLDLVITVDTSIAHLAAAAGKPTWIVISRLPDWRWMLDRSDSPWYPTVRLFRQPEFGDWCGAFMEVERALDELLAQRAAKRLM